MYLKECFTDILYAYLVIAEFKNFWFLTVNKTVKSLFNINHDMQIK
jgi:hypothetical protein